MRANNSAPDSTSISTGGELFTAPRLSVTFTLSAWWPAGTFVHIKAKGGDVSSPSLVTPEKNSTFWTLLPAFATSDTLAGSANTARLAGLVSSAVSPAPAVVHAFKIGAAVALSPAYGRPNMSSSVRKTV